MLSTWGVISVLKNTHTHEWPGPAYRSLLNILYMNICHMSLQCVLVV